MASEAEAAELLPQGVAMRDAVVADLIDVPGLRVECAVCARAGAGAPRGARPVVAEPGEPPDVFLRRQARGLDLVWAIAPEGDGVLAALQRAVGDQRWVGCNQASITTASSKSATLQALQARRVPTPLDHAARARRWVVKPDDGAGAIDTRVFASPADARAWAEARGAAGQRMVVEPWVDGEALSVSLMVGPGWVQALAFNRQRLNEGPDGQLHFDGVDVAAIDPRNDPRALRLHLLALDVVRAVPGLCGFVGVDVVWHAEDGPVAIELNPRLTSAYVGLSRALGRNLAAEALRAHDLTRAAALTDGNGEAAHAR